MDERDILPVEQSTSQLDSRHRTLLVRVFVVCSIFAVGLISAQMYFGVYKMPTLQLAKATPEDDPNAILKAKDTDHDGISDYDETNLYGTSPYLADSDSDGIDDRTELLNGSDPNCPQGKKCSSVTELVDRPTVENLGVAEPGPVPNLATSQEALNNLAHLGPAEVRALMKQNGVTDDVLKKLSDADLMAAYTAALEKSGVKSAQTESVPTNPTPEEIRKMLIDNGMSKEDAAKLTDEDLKKLYQDTLQKVAPKTTP
jgi:hypothetical protein